MNGLVEEQEILPPAEIHVPGSIAGAKTEPREWAGSEEDEFLSRVSVFDTQSAAVYLTEKTDVAFRPFSLDLFDKLVKVCKVVRGELEKEQRILEPDLLIHIKGQFPEGTEVLKFLNSISLLTNPAAVEALASLSPEEVTRLEFKESVSPFLRKYNRKFSLKKYNLNQTSHFFYNIVLSPGNSSPYFSR